MWCTRWYLPLLLLPLPTAPPYFLILFLLSLTLHAKPCFYCIVLLSTLFISSCYWQPFPLDTPLSTPWAENITTFAEALNSTLSSSYTGPLPTVIRAVDRCWCDISSGAFFVALNVSKWERASVLRLKDELERDQKNGLSSAAMHALNGTLSTISPPAVKLNSSAEYLPFRLPRVKLSSIRGLLTNKVYHEQAQSRPAPVASGPEQTVSDDAATSSSRGLDLRPYGIDLILDYDWSRS